ncbi:hypothetical protein GXY_05778 [Novacetimonas hansenii ATCC 23769]|uniref:Uncharacterized protein n=1 Tax=Novacetimonas hansenii ATCC 23769 TaxID=714995 RepID=D5QDE9_NOVHA|nr:hypothetical protein GXY_05778 [Novacetimonas hansenii ATCC 23769]
MKMASGPCGTGADISGFGSVARVPIMCARQERTRQNGEFA